MAILDEFDPQTNGWFFGNWNEPADFSWDLFRRTYLGVNPTPDPIAAPLDVAFYQIFKGCAAGGNCGGCSMLALALYKYGGFLGFCSPASFYTGPGGNPGPDRADLHAAINIMQARQFSAFGIQNFVDVVQAGDLNNGLAAFARIKSGLASGDYCMLSIGNGVIPNDAHTVIPYKVDDTTTPGTKVAWIWDPNFPFDDFPGYYTSDQNRITITGQTSWTYDQKQGVPTAGGTTYSGSFGGAWCFAIPMSLLLHKGRHPLSVGFILTNLALLFISGIGSAVTQISDDEGRRLYTSDRPHGPLLDDIETSSSRRLEGVARWPWWGRTGGATPHGDLYIVQRPPGAAPLTVSVRGADYNVIHATPGHLVEIDATGRAPAKDRIRVDDFTGTTQAVSIETEEAARRVRVHQLRAEGRAGDYRSVEVRDARVDAAGLRVATRGELDAVEVENGPKRRTVDLALSRYRDGALAKRESRPTIPADEAVRFRPRDWDSIKDTPVDRETTQAQSDSARASGRRRRSR
jgi:hypothetical protein